MSNPIANLTKKEWWVWICSLLGIIASNFLSGNVEKLTLAAACIGVTSLVLASIHEPRYVSVTIIFVIFFFYDVYGFISWKKREVAG